MEVVIADRRLRKDYEQRRQGWHQPPVVSGFEALVATFAACRDFDDVKALRTFSVHPLKGQRAGQYAAKLSGNVRAVFELAEDEQGQFVRIIEVLDYH